MSLYSLIGMSKGQRQHDADMDWLDDFTQQNIPNSERRAEDLATEYEKAVKAWEADKLNVHLYGEVERLREDADDAWELNLGNHVERWRLRGMS